MPRSSADDFSDWLSQTAGSFVRCAAYYDEDDIELLYIKDDVKSRYSDDDFDRIAAQMRREVRRSRAEGLLEMGEFQCSLWAFSEGILLHFPQDGSQGTVVTLEAGAARQFNEFAEECAGRIYDR